LIDSEHVLADLYRIVNVPTGVWIDEKGRIARPNDVVFGTDTFIQYHGISSAPQLEAVRRWVKTNEIPLGEAEVRKLQPLPTAEEQLARAEFTLAWHLHKAGRSGAAERHFVRAGELAPHDFTIRRGSMPIRGIDPMGPQFFEMAGEWAQKGNAYYLPLSR